MPQQPNDHGHTGDPQLDKLRDRLHNILSQADSSASSTHGSYGPQSGSGPQGSQGYGSYGQGGRGYSQSGYGSGRGQGQSQGSSLGSALLDEVLDLATGGLDSIARNVASSLGINDEPHGQGGHGGQGGYSGQGGGRGSHGGRGQGRGRQSLGQSIEEWADNFGPEEAMVEDPLMAMGKSEFGSLKKDLVRGLYEGLVPAEIRERIAEDLHRGLGTETRRNGVPPYESHAANSAHQHHSGHPSHGGHSSHAGQGRSGSMRREVGGGQSLCPIHGNNVERPRSAAATATAAAPRAAAPRASMSAQQVHTSSSVPSLDREQGPKMLMTSPEVMRARLKAEQAEEHLAELMSLCNSDEYYQLPHAIRVGVIQQIRKARSVLEQAQAAVAEAERRFPPIEVVRKPEPEPVVASEPEPEAYTETAAVTAADAEQQPTEQSQQVQPEQPKPWEEGALLWWKRFKALPLEEQHAQGQPIALQMVLQLQQDLGALEAMHLSAEDCREYMAHLPQPEEIAAIYCDDQLRLALLQLCNSLREELAVMLAQTPKTEQDTPAADATDAADAAESTEPAAAKTVESAGETSVADTSGGGDTDESNFAEDDDLPWMQGPWGWWTQFRRLSPTLQSLSCSDQHIMALLVQLQEELQFLDVDELSDDERRAAAEHLPRTEEIAGLWCADHLKAALDDVCQNLRAELLVGLDEPKTEPTAQEPESSNVVAQQAAEKQPATETQPAADIAESATVGGEGEASATAPAGVSAAAADTARAESSAARMCMDAEVRQSDFGPQRVTLLGATGSIGDSTCEVLRQHPERYVVHALAANSNVEKMLALIAEFKPERVAMSNEHAATALRERLAEDPALAALHIEVLEGSRGVVEVAGDGAAEIVVGAIVGSSGLPPVLAALKTGCRVCLANKEALVMSGKLFFDVAQQFGSTVVPVDSEHSAIFQCLPPQEQRRLGSCHLAEVGVKEILLTGSGGPFRDCDLEVLKTVTPKMAINHPVWSMGPKISVDSATMMNKALEFIEARYLFNARADQIKVIIHPQSVIHSMVSYVDGAGLAQMGQPDMKTPIAHALAYPERISAPVQSLDFTQISALTFKEPDPQRYPCLFMGIEASNQGQASTTALNAANEVAVSAFLHEQLSFLGIADVVKHVLDKLSATQAYTLEEIMDVDRQARELATAFVRSRQA